MSNLETHQIELALRELARVTGSVALYLDRAEHLEPSVPDAIGDAVRRLRTLAVSLAADLDIEIVEAYAARLAQLEHRNVIAPNSGIDPPQMVRVAQTWRDIQMAQIEHDRWYHPDVFGLPRIDQLHHFLLHLAKLTATLAGLFDPAADWLDFVDRRLPDIAVFSVKLATVGGIKLPLASIERLQVRGIANVPAL